MLKACLVSLNGFKHDFKMKLLTKLGVSIQF